MSKRKSALVAWTPRFGLAAVAVVAACSPEGTTEVNVPQFNLIIDPSVDVPPPVPVKPGTVTVCKVGGSAEFTIDSLVPSGGSFVVNVADGQCVDVFTAVGNPDNQTMLITENLGAGESVDSIRIYAAFTGHEGTGSLRDTVLVRMPTVFGQSWLEGHASDTKVGCVVIFYNHQESPGTGTPGYWKNHPAAWPVDQITVGGVTYSREDAIGFMKDPVKGDKTFNMFEALVAAMLNVLIGNDASCIQGTIDDANDWLATYPLGSGVKASSEAWKVGEPLFSKLDAYNNGLLCAPHRES